MRHKRPNLSAEPTATSAPATSAVVLWYRPPARPGGRRVWEILGTFASERDAWKAATESERGSGDYLTLPDDGSQP